MPIRINRARQTAILTATLLAATAFVTIPFTLSRAVAEEESSAENPPPPTEAQAAEPAQGSQDGVRDEGKHEDGIHEEGMHQDGMHEEGMHQGGMHEGGMQGCKMMGGDCAGMMGEHSGEMRKKMHEMMAEMAAHADERIAALKSDLQVTEAQLPQWTVFADALRSAAHSMEQDMKAPEAGAATPKPAASPEPRTTGGNTSFPDMDAIKKIEPPPAPQEQEKNAKSLPGKLERHEKRLGRLLDSLKAIEAALVPLYATFDDEQKKAADRLKIGPMGLM